MQTKLLYLLFAQLEMLLINCTLVTSALTKGNRIKKFLLDLYMTFYINYQVNCLSNEDTLFALSL